MPQFSDDNYFFDLKLVALAGNLILWQNHFSSEVDFIFLEKEEDFMNLFGEELKSWIFSIAGAIILALIIRTFIVELYVVDGPSMRPTLQHEERLVVNKFIYRVRNPERGEIIIFRYPRDPSRDFIKRVIAVGGDTIEIKDGRVYVNDEIIREDYIMEKTRTEYPKVTVPEGTIFVCGDNRDNSLDSRSADVGFLPLENVKGKAMLIFWPADEFKTLP